MLVLSRKTHDSVVIGTGPDAVTVTVIAAEHGVVRLGFQAPRSVKIIRGELGPWRDQAAPEATEGPQP